MAMAIEQLHQQFPWHCNTLDEQQVAISRISDLSCPSAGDLAIGNDGLIYLFDGQNWR